VNPVTPTLTTHAGTSPVDFGQPINDTADLTGTANQPGSPIIGGPLGSPAGGTITFTAYGPNDCSTVAFTSSAVPVTGDATYGPVSFTPSSPGTYHWVATYTGDSPNTSGPVTDNAACDQAREDVVVNQVQTAITTRQFVFPQDKAVITAPAGTLAGSVSFKLYNNLANCTANGATGLLYSEGPDAISGASPQAATTSNTIFRQTSDTTGIYWRVTYTSTNPAQLGSSSVCTESTAVTYTGNDSGISIP
jgi:hypothetical protein